MYGDWCTMAWINGLRLLSMRLRPIGYRKVSCAIHAAFEEITMDCLEEALCTSTLLKEVSWIIILFGPSMVNLEF
jgi:hypothetical protein